MSSAPSIPDAAATREPSGAGKAVAGFLVSGFLMAFLGAILPAWGAHRDPPEFAVVGNYFLCFGIGVAASAVIGRRMPARRGISFSLVFSCAAACAALIFLAFVSPPASAWWRAGGLLVLGAAAGILNLALFHALSAAYTPDPAGTVTRGGVWFGLGSLAATLLVAATLYSGLGTILCLMAVIPGVFAAIYARSFYPAAAGHAEPTMGQALRDFHTPGAVLFALLLFFQFGNEWSIAGWMPLFLIRRVGLSPTAALVNLAMYWLFLMAGRFGAVAILPRVRHGRLLLASVLSALFGCVILYSTKTGFGAASAAFFIGAGYASIYPLVAEAIGRRFPYYHPGFFNGILSVAMLGGLLAPATLGYAAARWGVGVAVGIPLLGTCMVMVLMVSIWLESKVTGR